MEGSRSSAWHCGLRIAEFPLRIEDCGMRIYFRLLIGGIVDSIVDFLRSIRNPSINPQSAILNPQYTLLVTFVLQAALLAQPAAPLSTFEVVERTIPQLQDAMRAGEVTSRQLVEIYRARIEAYD